MGEQECEYEAKWYRTCLEEKEPDPTELLGKEAADCLLLLEKELLSLECDWAVYKGLFGFSEERVSIFNEASGLVAWTVEKTMWSSIAMRISHLGDPKKTCGHENLSIKRLVSLVKTSGWSEEDIIIFNRLQNEVTDKIECLDFLRDKVLAHTDYKTAASKYRGVERPSRKTIDETIVQVKELLNHVRKASGLCIVSSILIEEKINKKVSDFFNVLKVGNSSLDWLLHVVDDLNL